MFCSRCWVSDYGFRWNVPMQFILHYIQLEMLTFLGVEKKIVHFRHTALNQIFGWIFSSECSPPSFSFIRFQMQNEFEFVRNVVCIIDYNHMYVCILYLELALLYQKYREFQLFIWLPFVFNSIWRSNMQHNDPLFFVQNFLSSTCYTTQLILSLNP